MVDMGNHLWALQQVRRRARDLFAVSPDMEQHEHGSRPAAPAPRAHFRRAGALLRRCLERLATGMRMEREPQRTQP